MLLIDTNVLIDILGDDPEWAEWSIAQLRAQAKVHPLIINPIIYAELSLTFSTVEALDSTLASLDIAVMELPRPALFLAGKAFILYKQQGGTKHNVLAGFFIGAHAAVLGCPLITRDARRYKTYFPSVKLITP
jgi:predicted nucleic acid-binding protein